MFVMGMRVGVVGHVRARGLSGTSSHVGAPGGVSAYVRGVSHCLP